MPEALVTANGESDGYHAYLSYDSSRRRIIIVLSNSGRKDAEEVAVTLTENIGKIIDKKPVKRLKAFPLEANLHAGIYISGQDTLQIVAEQDRLKFLATGQRLIEALSGEKKVSDLVGPERERDLFSGFVLPTAEEKLTYFDLATGKEKILLFSESYREIWVGELKLERVYRP